MEELYDTYCRTGEFDINITLDYMKKRGHKNTYDLELINCPSYTKMYYEDLWKAPSLVEFAKYDLSNVVHSWTTVDKLWDTYCKDELSEDRSYYSRASHNNPLKLLTTKDHYIIGREVLYLMHGNEPYIVNVYVPHTDINATYLIALKNVNYKIRLHLYEIDVDPTQIAHANQSYSDGLVYSSHDRIVSSTKRAKLCYRNGKEVFDIARAHDSQYMNSIKANIKNVIFPLDNKAIKLLERFRWKRYEGFNYRSSVVSKKSKLDVIQNANTYKDILTKLGVPATLDNYYKMGEVCTSIITKDHPKLLYSTWMYIVYLIIHPNITIYSNCEKIHYNSLSELIHDKLSNLYDICY